MDYEPSKKAIISQVENHIEKHKAYVWYKVPTSLFEIEEIKLLNVKEITDFSPLKEFKNLKSLIFGTTDCSMTIKDLKGLSSAQTIESLTFMCKTKIKSNIDEISKLLNLKSLGLYNVIHEIPEDLIKNLDKLEKVSLSKQNYASLAGLSAHLKEVSINVDSIAEFPNWDTVATITHVNIGSNTCQFENLNSFSRFPNVQSIKLNAPKKLNDISFVKSLNNLKSIEINFAPIDNLQDFSDHSAIEEIKLRGSNVTDLSNLGTLSKMKILYLEKSKLKNIDDIKVTFPNLELLWIWDTKVKDLSPLRGMTTIRELDATKLKPKSWDFISSLTGLETLDLCKSTFSDINLINELPKLKYVRLSGSKVDPKSDSYKSFKEQIESREGRVK